MQRIENTEHLRVLFYYFLMSPRSPLPWCQNLQGHRVRQTREQTQLSTLIEKVEKKVKIIFIEISCMAPRLGLEHRKVQGRLSVITVF